MTLIIVKVIETAANIGRIITGGAVAQPCVNSHWLSQWEPSISTHYKIDVA